MAERFRKWANKVSEKVGTHWAFGLALGSVVAWALAGPLFHFSDPWQLTINTATTIVTFLMVFLIQSTQNRDTEAIQLKLSELIRAVEGAHNVMLDLEELTEKELDVLRLRYLKLAAKAREGLRAGSADTGKIDFDTD